MPKIDYEYYTTCSKEKHKFNIKLFTNGTVKINKKENHAKIEKSDDGFDYVVIKNKKYPIEIIEKNQNKYHVLINGNSYYFNVDTPFSFRRRKVLNKRKQDSKKEVVVAPMPGKIVDIMVEENLLINEGDSLIILEAMKMQNEIKSSVKGTVKKVNIKPGENVNKNDVLVEIEK